MAKFEFEYTEIDGLLYSNIEIEGKNELDNLGKYGRLLLNYLYEQKPGMYRQLLLTGKLTDVEFEVIMRVPGKSKHLKGQEKTKIDNCF